MNKFRLLKADEIECRVASIREKGLSLLLYKTARTDANLLDETVGEYNWQNDFKLVDGVLYGGLGIKAGESWVWKWDAGTESNTEAEKGRASDAFKRAGFKWGIGRELYTAPFIWVPIDKCNIEKGKCYDRFRVESITYNDRAEIQGLVIINDSTGNIAYSYGTTANMKPIPELKPLPPVEKPLYKCDDCGREIKPYTDKNGKPVSLRAHKMRSESRFGKCLCLDCINARSA